MLNKKSADCFSRAMKTLELDKVLDNAIRAGLPVVLDLHGLSNISGDYSGNKDLYDKIWHDLAERYAALPLSVAFQIINEPSTTKVYDSITNVDPMTSAELMEMQERIIRNFRKIKGNEERKAVVGTDTNGHWNFYQYTSSLLGLGNIIVDFHFYEPMSFTHSGANWCLNEDGSMQYPANATDFSTANPASAFSKAT